MKQTAQNVLATFLVGLAILTIGLVVMSATATVAKSDKASEKSEKSEKTTKENKKPIVDNGNSKKVNGTDIEVSKKQEKANEKAGKKVVTDEDETLDVVAKKAKQKKQEKIAQDVTIVVEENEEMTEDVEEVIEEVKTQNKFKKMLVGTDYKNLGSLRSSLVKNRNQIRKLTRSMDGATPEVQALIGAELLALTGERDQIKTVITTNEEGFSLLGWAFRLINGYPAEPIDEVAEDNLAGEVQEALDDVDNEEEDEEDNDEGMDEEGEEEENDEDVNYDEVEDL